MRAIVAIFLLVVAGVVTVGGQSFLALACLTSARGEADLSRAAMLAAAACCSAGCGLAGAALALGSADRGTRAAGTLLLLLAALGLRALFCA